MSPLAIRFNGRTYFTADELRCKGSGLLILAPGFVEALLALRLAWGKPLVPTSCCRSTAHNTAVGGARDSRHICDNSRGGCDAIDLRIAPEDRRAFVQLALAMGWTVGVNNSFVHIDRRPEPRLFPY